MDEIITEERKQNLIQFITDVANADILTNGDALAIIDILQQACERKKVVMYEDLVKKLIEDDDGDDLD